MASENILTLESCDVGVQADGADERRPDGPDDKISVLVSSEKKRQLSAMEKVGYFRHFLVLLVFLGLVITYMLRVNLSVAILAMVNNTALAEIDRQNQINQTSSNYSIGQGSCSPVQTGGGKPARDGQFVWDAKTRGVILGAFFYGYIVTELPGGWFSYKFGGKWIFGLGMLWTAIFTLLTPLTAHLDLPLLIVVRVLEGLGEGVAFPCVHGLFAQWVPPAERTRMPAFTFAGIGIGTVIAFPFSAALCDTETGWPLVFYVFGAIGVAWFIVWSIFGDSTPAKSYWISKEEREYIQQSLAETVVEDEMPSCSSVPWCKIAKTPAAWSLMISHMSFTWGLYTLITLLPTYFKDVLHMNMAKNGIYSALPYICFTVVAIFIGPVSDHLIARGTLSVGVARKIMDGIGHTLPGVFLLLTTVIGCNMTAAVVLMCLAVGSEGFVGAGSFANNLDLAGRFAGVTFGIYNTLGSVCGVVAPFVAGMITQKDNTIAGWRAVFGIAAAFYWTAALAFVIFGKGEPAEWARIESEKEKEPEKGDLDNEKKMHSGAVVYPMKTF